ncbi:MAG: DUF4358 domain-containing protein [Clostridia bacterium]|nr:DUF4358 domain-containing protein [Clostridia bacterium]
MKRLISILLICVVCLMSCSTKENKADETNYKNDVKVSEISSKILEVADISALTVADDGWVALNIPLDLSLCEESSVYIHTAGSSDMFGVFKATSIENAEKFLADTETFLENLEENWMSEYLAEEFPKIENAVAKRCGLYVTFLILDNDIRTAAETEFENMLKQ